MKCKAILVALLVLLSILTASSAAAQTHLQWAAMHKAEDSDTGSLDPIGLFVKYGSGEAGISGKLTSYYISQSPGNHKQRLIIVNGAGKDVFDKTISFAMARVEGEPPFYRKRVTQAYDIVLPASPQNKYWILKIVMDGDIVREIPFFIVQR